MPSIVMPLKRYDPHDIAKDAQQLDHDRVSFDPLDRRWPSSSNEYNFQFG
jgi:hypothetical protein